MTSGARGEAGQVSVMALGLALVAFSVAGITIDGTRAFVARRTLQNAADSSALAGASELDTRAYYSSDGRVVVLDASSARRITTEWLARRGLRARASIATGTAGVRVVLHDAVDTSFLRLIGIARIPVAAEAVAEPVPGARGPGP